MTRPPSQPPPQSPQPLHSPSAWLLRWQHLLVPGGSLLDVACGPGRHLHPMHALGMRVTGVDRAADAIASLAPLAAAGAEIVQADIEGGPWPFAGRQFDTVLVFNYLWRPRLADIVAAVAPGGVLLYETFAMGNADIGKPSRPDFLLRPGELLQAAAGLHVVAYEDGFLEAPPRCVQRIAAVREAAPELPARHRL